MDKRDPAKKVIELMKQAQPQKTDATKGEAPKIEIQGSGNIVLIGGATADLCQRITELEQTLQTLLSFRQQTEA